MVAYSFKRRFVVPIQQGLGIDNINLGIPPKRQTIRAHGRRRHARPGDELQLYTAMRTKQCELIGNARCVSIQPIKLRFERGTMAANVNGIWLSPRRMAAFARSDGFADLAEMIEFWKTEHGVLPEWYGLLIKWEPLDAKA